MTDRAGQNDTLSCPGCSLLHRSGLTCAAAPSGEPFAISTSSRVAAAMLQMEAPMAWAVSGLEALFFEEGRGCRAVQSQGLGAGATSEAEDGPCPASSEPVSPYWLSGAALGKKPHLKHGGRGRPVLCVLWLITHLAPAAFKNLRSGDGCETQIGTVT